MIDVTDINIHRATDMALGAVDVARDCDKLGLHLLCIDVSEYGGVSALLAGEDQVDALAELYGMDADTGIGVIYARRNHAREIGAYCERSRPAIHCGCGEPCTHKATP